MKKNKFIKALVAKAIILEEHHSTTENPIC
jgi:hypothetical protein